MITLETNAQPTSFSANESSFFNMGLSEPLFGFFSCSCYIVRLQLTYFTMGMMIGNKKEEGRVCNTLLEDAHQLVTID